MTGVCSYNNAWRQEQLVTKERQGDDFVPCFVLPNSRGTECHSLVVPSVSVSLSLSVSLLRVARTNRNANILGRCFC